MFNPRYQFFICGDTCTCEFWIRINRSLCDWVTEVLQMKSIYNRHCLQYARHTLFDEFFQSTALQGPHSGRSCHHKTTSQIPLTMASPPLVSDSIQVSDT